MNNLHPIFQAALAPFAPRLNTYTVQIKYGRHIVSEHTVPADHSCDAVSALLDRLQPGQYLQAFPASGPRFANVSCSQCGCEFGPGDHGFSHCANHGAIEDEPGEYICRSCDGTGQQGIQRGPFLNAACNACNGRGVRNG